MELATCTYQEFQIDMGIPVRTTAGPPRFKLGYELVGHARLVTPTRAMLALDREPYRAAYRRQLAGVGLDAILAELAQLAAPHHAARLVLLCFERLNKPGLWCHRTMLAEWLQERTGQDVSELGAVLEPQPPTLFDL